jgi:hypothetical protein
MPRRAAANLPSKPCVVCGRPFSWRKKWERNWEQVRFCSDACRKRGVQPVDDGLERAILELLAGRDFTASICPSEAARACDPQGWQSLLTPVRAAARRLADRGLIEVTQQGRVVDAATAKGPIRLRPAHR